MAGEEQINSKRGSFITFYELALLLVICSFPAILFSLSASYNLIIFYELALNTEENCEKIWKIQKKIVKRYEKYERNPS
jgi:hypothetical protein